MSIMIAALVGLASANQRSAASYRNLRTDRYAGDSAIKAAVNWAKDKHDVARDPDAYPTDPLCVYKVPETNTVVTCEATPDEGSGTPTGVPGEVIDEAKAPEQALLLLGHRYGEPGPNSPCSYGDNATTPNPGNFNPNGTEVGLRMNANRVTGLTAYAGGDVWTYGWKALCASNTVPNFDGDASFNKDNPFTIDGPVVSNSPVVVNDGWLSVQEPHAITAGTSPRYDKLKGCTATRPDDDGIKRIQGDCNPLPLVPGGDRDNPSGSAMDPWNPGEIMATDPAIGSAGPFGEEWLQGEIDWRDAKVSINKRPAKSLEGLSKSDLDSACTGTADNIVRFYPGWYSSATAINSIFNNDRCKSGVFWFGPANGLSDPTDVSLPTEAKAEQGVYLFDFRDVSKNAGDSNWWMPREYNWLRCGLDLDNDTYAHRWCLNSAKVDPGTGPRVVGGWPKGWDPANMTTDAWYPTPPLGQPAEPAVYCDADRPGVQFVFGGDSTVRAANASMQLCAGPAPGDHSNAFQRIAVWGQPQNFLTKDGAVPIRKKADRPGVLLPRSAAVVPRNTPNQIFTQDCTFNAAIIADPSIKGCFLQYPERSLLGGSPYTENAQPKKAPASLFTTTETSGGFHSVVIRYDDFGHVEPFSTCSAETDVCFDPATQKVDRVKLKVSYDGKCTTTSNDADCNGDDDAVQFALYSPKSSVVLCDRPKGFPGTSSQKAYTYEVTDCFLNGGTVDREWLNTVKLNLKHRWKGSLAASQRIKEQVSAELIVTLAPLTKKTEVVMPASGCRVSPYGYSAGVGDGHSHIGNSEKLKNFDSNLAGRDCALFSGGRVSIQGTVYAPQDAIEIDNDDVRYSVISRGLVARHLRVRRYLSPLSPPPPAITNYVDRTPEFREATFTACERADMGPTSACGQEQGDKVIASARVRFDKDVAVAEGDQARVPSFLWWSTEH